MRVHVADLMDAFAQYGREDVAASPMHEYVVDFFTGGVYMLLRSWSRDGLATPSAQMAELTYSLLAARSALVTPGLPPGPRPRQGRRSGGRERYLAAPAHQAT